MQLSMRPSKIIREIELLVKNRVSFQIRYSIQNHKTSFGLVNHQVINNEIIYLDQGIEEDLNLYCLIIDFYLDAEQKKFYFDKEQYAEVVTTITEMVDV